VIMRDQRSTGFDHSSADNLAEQKVLERIGFTREGVLRQVAFRDGAWRDAVVYALLRDDESRR
jgi:[ribosomal protein S5]-alanine N-acetyltransferase